MHVGTSLCGHLFSSLLGGYVGVELLHNMVHLCESMSMSLSKLWEMVKDKEAWNTAVHGSPKSQM